MALMAEGAAGQQGERQANSLKNEWTETLEELFKVSIIQYQYHRGSGKLPVQTVISPISP